MDTQNKHPLKYLYGKAKVKRSSLRNRLVFRKKG